MNEMKLAHLMAEERGRMRALIWRSVTGPGSMRDYLSWLSALFELWESETLDGQAHARAKDEQRLTTHQRARDAGLFDVWLCSRFQSLPMVFDRRHDVGSMFVFAESPDATR